jgi:hypothetical protein
VRVQELAVNFTVAGNSPWVKLDYYPCPTNVSILFSEDSGAAVAANLGYIIGDPSSSMAHLVSLSQTTNTITVKDAGPPLGVGFGPNLGHGLAAGDFVELDLPGGTAGFSVTTVTDPFTYTLTSPTSQSLPQQNVMARTAPVVVVGTTDPIFAANPAIPAGGMVARTVLTVRFPVYAVQLQAVTVTTPGVCRLFVMQSGQKS